MKYRKILSIFALLILSACSAAGAGASPTPDSNAVATSAFSTAFAYLTETGVAVSANATATPSATASLTPPPPPTPRPTVMPTIQPIIGTANAQTNIRSGPGKGGNDRVGGLLWHQQVQVIGRNPAGNWLWIIYPEAPAGTAWVLAAAIDFSGDITHLPIAIARENAAPFVFPPILYEITGTPLPLNTPAAGAKTATISQLAKVRVGPGVGYSNIATLPAGTIVTVTGRTAENDWLQIEYPSGIQGQAWISGEVAQMKEEFAGIPFYNFMGTQVASKAEALGGIILDSGDEPSAEPNATSEPNATPQATGTPEPKISGVSAEVYQASEINVRGGPASSYDPLGTLKTGDKVVVTGETINQLWYQIVYSSGPGGYGWVSTKYIKITGGDMNTLHYFDTQGTPLPNP